MRARRLAVGVAVGCAVSAVGMVSALAVDPSTVKIVAGTAPNGTAITLTAVNTNVFNLKDLRSGLIFSCPVGSVSLRGTTTVGTIPNNPAVSITGATFTNCRFSGLALTLTPAVLPWRLTASGVTASNTTPARITGLKLNGGFSNCTFELGNGSGGTGTIDTAGGGLGVKYVNSSTPSIQLQTTGTASAALLGINSTVPVGGCNGNILLSGDKVQFYGGSTSTTSATFNVTAVRSTGGTAANPLALTAP